MKPRVCAVIVTYNCTSDLAQNVALLRPQVETLLIVDNGSRPESLQVLETVQRDHACTVILNGTNLGMAAALNIGVTHAMRNGFEWLATFDQDSQVSGDFIPALLDAYAADAANTNVGMVLPRYKDRVSGDEVPLGSKYGHLVIGITSGAITRLAVFESCGLFEEGLFIDCVDTEFCLRISRNSWRIIESGRAILLHSLGRMVVRELGGLRLDPTNHSAARRYYIARNRMVVWRRYFWRYPRWAIDDIRKLLRELVMILILEIDKGKKLAFTLLGFRDALMNRMGYRKPL